MTAKATLTTASTTTTTTSGRSGRRPPSSRRNEPRKSFGLAGGRPMPMPIIPARAAAGRPAGPPGSGRRGAGPPAGARRRGCRPRRPPPGRPLMPRPPPRTAASRRSRDRSRWSRAARGGCRCRRPGPSSMTMIRSAFMIVADPLGDDDHRRVAELALERRPQPGVGREVERGEAVVEDVDRGARLTSARAIASRWRWPPETFVPPWVIGASRPPSISSTKSRAWAISSACHSSSSVASASPKRRLLATVPPNRNAFCGMTPMRRHRSSRACSRTSTPSTRTAPLGHVVEARDEVDQRRLAAAGAADDRRRLAGLAPERDVAQDRVLGARVAELDVAELDDATLAGPSVGHGPASSGSSDRRLGLEDLAGCDRRTPPRGG